MPSSRRCVRISKPTAASDEDAGSYTAGNPRPPGERRRDAAYDNANGLCRPPSRFQDVWRCTQRQKSCCEKSSGARSTCGPARVAPESAARPQPMAYSRK
ncbi:Uncharacterised protein [Bordetella pertussis]|nr:Uncharacterised protein [Bordetella pertussis]